MKRKASTLMTIKSREDLLNEYQMPVTTNKRTKILCSINQQTCDIDVIRDMIKAGANSLSINAAYIKDRKIYKKLAEIRDQLEEEMDRTIPINMMLQGTMSRIGQLRQPEVHLKRKQILRLTQDFKVVGDQRIVSVDQGDIFSQTRVNDRLAIDYGQIQMRVMGITTDEEAKRELMELYPDSYENLDSFRDPIYLQRKQSINSQSSLDSAVSYSSNSSAKKKKYTEKKKKFQDYKKNPLKFKSLICEVLDDCILRPHKAVFCIKRENDEDDEDTEEQEFIQNNQQLQSSDSDELESQITCKDINDFALAKKLNYDVITLSNVTSEEEVKELRFLLGSQCKSQVFVRISDKRGVENFDKIMQHADGCIIARAYICLNYQIEDFVQMQHKLIQKCRKMLKPVIISTQILESMLTQAQPTFTEIGDIANVLEEHVDGLMISGEMTYTYNPVKVVAALSRVCHNIEHQYQKPRDFQGQFDILPDSKPIISVIASSAVDTAKLLYAKMILLFTSAQITSLTLSKLEAVCQVVALTAKLHIARALNFIGGVTPILLGSLYGEDKLTLKVLKQLEDKEWLSKGDFVIVITGQFGTEEGIINQLKILQI